MFVPELEYENTFLGLKYGKEGEVGLQFYDKSKYLKKNLAKTTEQASWDAGALTVSGTFESYATRFSDFHLELVVAGSGKNAELVHNLQNFETEIEQVDERKVINWKATLEASELEDFVREANKNVNVGFSMKFAAGQGTGDFRLGADPQDERANADCLAGYMESDVFKVDKWYVIPYLTNKGSFSLKISKPNNLFKTINFDGVEISRGELILSGSITSATLQREGIEPCLKIMTEDKQFITLNFDRFEKREGEFSVVDWSAKIKKSELRKFFKQNKTAEFKYAINVNIAGKKLDVPLTV